MNVVKKSEKGRIEDLQHIDFDKDGCVYLALHRKATQKKLWESLQQFKDIKPSRLKSKDQEQD